MCSLAPSAPLGMNAAAFLDRRRGVAAVAPAACGVVARDPVRRVGAVVSSAPPPTKKRARDGFDGNLGEREGLAAAAAAAASKVSAVREQGQQRLEERVRAELDAIRVLHRKALLLCRGAAPAAKDGARFSVAGARSEAPMEESEKRRKMLPLKQSTEPAKKQQQRLVHRATPPPTKCSVAKPVDMCRGDGRSSACVAHAAKFSAAGLRKKQPANQKEAVKQQQPPIQRATAPSAKEVQKRRLMEEIAQAREKCRQEVLEIERTALPDETIYQKDLEELGIFFQYAVTRTWKQAHGPAV